jgi:hypothetical protein
MTWRERERLLYLGSMFSLIPALAIVPAFTGLVFIRTIPDRHGVAFLLFPILSSPNSFGVFKLVQSSWRGPSAC